MEQTITEKQNSIKLSKGMNDKYSWEIKIYFDEEAPLTKLNEINNKLKEKYGK